MRKFVLILASAGMLLGLSLHASADTTAEDAYNYRTAVMTSLRGHIGAASMIVRGLVADGDIVGHARGLDIGVQELHNLFAEGSNVEESEALPAIWANPDDFAAAIAKIKEATTAFVAAAESGDSEAIGGAFRNVGMSCRGCHDNFRVAQD